MGKQRKYQGVFLSVAGAFWAAAYLIPYRQAASHANAFDIVLPMLLWAAIINTIISGVSLFRSRLTIDRRTCWVALVLAALAVLGNYGVAESIVRVDPGLTSTVLRVQILFVAIFGFVWLREKVTLRFGIGSLIALVGFGLLHGVDAEFSQSTALGVAWAVLAAVSFGAMQVVIRRFVRQMQLLSLNAIRLWLAVFLLAAIPGRLQALFSLESRVWLLTGLAALFGPIFSRLCLMGALLSLPAAYSTLITFVAPLFAFLLTFLFFGIVPDLAEIVACCVILLGVMIPVVEMVKRANRREWR